VTAGSAEDGVACTAGGGKLGADLAKRLRVKPGSRVMLGRIDPAETYGHSKGEAAGTLQASHDRLESLQERLWAGGGGSLPRWARSAR